jgi:2-amino-4-hydroxy-6-hydroxymethyldihydropteridine pyrophosphokinase
MEHVVYLALGTNLGDRPANLKAAVAALSPHVVVYQVSQVYETPPWGITDQPAFLNMVLKGGTSLDPRELLERLKRLETKLGRVAGLRWGPRQIDLDILFFDDIVLDSPGLTIPHPHLHERAFVLVPLADLAPGLCHPILHKTVGELLSALDATGVMRYE